jgi:4-amino-4-deoxy-L-arabinose transferase-like glycosyltransferase
VAGRRSSSWARSSAGFLAAVALLLALTAGTRVALVLATPDYGVYRDTEDELEAAFDPFEHDGIAASLVLGHGFEGQLPPKDAFRAPGYPYFLAGIYELAGLGSGRIEAARLVQVALGVLAIALTGLIARRLFDRRVAIAAMAIAALYLPLALVQEALLSEALFVPLVLGAVAAALGGREAHPLAARRTGWVLAAGGLAGMATLVRPNGLALLLPLALLVWPRPRLRVRSLAAPVLLVAAALAAIAPWTIRNAVELDRFALVNVQSGYTLAGTFNEVARHAPGVQRGEWVSPSRVLPYKRNFDRWRRGEIDELELNDRLADGALDYARTHPGYVAEVGFWNIVRLLGFGTRERSRLTLGTTGYGEAGLADAARYSFWVLAALALAGLALTRRWRAPALWLVPLLLVLSTAFVTSSTPRARTPAEPFLAILAAAGAVRLAALARRPSAEGALSPGLVSSKRATAGR